MTALLLAWALLLAIGGAQAQAQPTGRAYEMVSPLDKNGGDVDRDFISLSIQSQSGSSASGDAAAFTSRLQFGDIESGAISPTYVARRGDTGWRTEGVTPPIGHADAEVTEAPAVNGLSLDLSKAFVRASPSLAPGAENLSRSWGLYMRSGGEPQPYTLLSVPWTTLAADPDLTGGFASTRFEYVADTPDSRHVVFNSGRQLLPEAPPGISNRPDDAVYEWVDGSLRLASVPPPGVPSFATNQDVVAGAVIRGTSGSLPGDHVISDDGRRLFFRATVPGGGLQLFVREDGTTTVAVSRSERPADPPLVPGANAVFWAAKSNDGSVAFFRAAAPLTESAGTTSLYRWDANAPEGERLTELSQDPLGQPSVSGPAAVNDDATSVAFVATGLLDPDATGVTRGERNLYLWRQGEGVRHIATLEGNRDANVSTPRTSLGGRAARVSADGERLLFASFAQLDPAYDTTEETPEACGNPAAAGDRCRQIYLYDARRDELSCLTCVRGVPVTGDADLFGNSEQGRPRDPDIDTPYRQPRNLSADGTRAFFETARPLVAGDRNSTLDVYQWEDRDLDGQGELQLLSPGRGTTDSKFVDASVSGDDVFFTTLERLVGIDTDNQVDLYDARVGGGIPAQNPPPPSTPCEGEACQGALSGVPLLPGVGSAIARPGNQPPALRPSFSVVKLSSADRARLARGRRVRVRVRVSQAGKVSLTARARLGKRTRTVARASRTAPRAGTVELGLRLPASARRELARKRKLAVSLVVRFAGVKAAKTSKLSLRAARPSARRRAR